MPMRQPLPLSAVLLSGLFLPALLHPFVEPWIVVAIVIGVALSARIPPLAQRLSERQRLRRSGVLRAIVLSCTTVVVVLGSLEYLAFALSDLGVVQHLTPMRTVLASDRGGVAIFEEAPQRANLRPVRLQRGG